MASSADIIKFINEAISQDKVVVFSLSHCPYCIMAKRVFKEVEQPIKVYELNERSDGNAIRENLAEITGCSTVPQVFINGKCVGGCDAVEHLYETGKLQPMLFG